jgi:hypothetical protein
MLPPGERFNRDFILDEVLERYDEHRSETRKKKRSYGIFSHIENVSPHLVQSKYNLMGIHQLSHPLYSPDIASCNFWLFRYLKMKLEGMFFDRLAALLA